MKRKISKIISVVLCIALLAGVASVFSFAADGELQYELTDFGTAQLVSCPKDLSGKVTVDDKVMIDGKEYKVQAIGDNAFEGCEKITQITIPEGITIIGAKAFASCESLETVDVPKSLITCSYDAFADCNTVTVNCYSSNYQFFTVYGFSENIKVNILDAEFNEEQTEHVNSIVDIIRKLIKIILSWFGIK